MLPAPGGLKTVDVATDLRSPRAERADIRRELDDLTGLGVEGEPMRGEDPTKLLSGDGGVPDPVDRLNRIADPDRMDAASGAGRPDAGVDLEVRVAVRFAGPRGVVPDHCGLDLLDRYLHLAVPGPDAGGGVLGDPADDLGGGPVLGGVQRRGDLGMQGSGQGSGLGSVDGDLDEPQRVRILAESALRFPRFNVDPGHPLLVRVAGQLAEVLDAVRGGGQSGGDAGALAEVVVIGTGSVAFDIGARRVRCAAVELHAAMHPDHPPRRRPSTTNGPLDMPSGPPDHGRPIYQHA